MPNAPYLALSHLKTLVSYVQHYYREPLFLCPFFLDSQRGFMGTIAYDYSRSIAEHSVNRRRSTEAYRRVMSTWPSMMVGTAEGDLAKLFSPALLA